MLNNIRSRVIPALLTTMLRPPRPLAVLINSSAVSRRLMSPVTATALEPAVVISSITSEASSAAAMSLPKTVAPAGPRPTASPAPPSQNVGFNSVCPPYGPSRLRPGERSLDPQTRTCYNQGSEWVAVDAGCRTTHPRLEGGRNAHQLHPGAGGVASRTAVVLHQADHPGAP